MDKRAVLADICMQQQFLRISEIFKLCLYLPLFIYSLIHTLTENKPCHPSTYCINFVLIGTQKCCL